MQNRSNQSEKKDMRILNLMWDQFTIKKTNLEHLLPVEKLDLLKIKENLKTNFGTSREQIQITTKKSIECLEFIIDSS